MKKVLIITNHSYMLYRFRLDLIRTLMQTHEVVLCMPFVGHEQDFQDMGLRCIETKLERRGINPVADLKLFGQYLQIIREEKPDMVITYSIKPNVYAGVACQLFRVPYCANVQGLGTTFQGGLLTRLVTVMYRTAFLGVKKVFFENEGNAEKFRQLRIVAPEKQRILPGAGINLQAYSLTPYPENDRIHFLFLGRIMAEKGMDELITAMRRLRQEYGDRVILDIVGFYEDDFREKVEALVSEGTAVFHGFQSEPLPYYAKADCVVLASYHEGMSNVLLEGAAMGRPVITSDIPGCREAVDDGVTGYLCQAKDAESLYVQMRRMTELSWQERRAMGIAGHEKMQRQFEKQMVVSRTIDAIFE